MIETKIAEVLEDFRQHLPEEPEWIALNSLDGLFVGLGNLPEKERIINKSAAIDAFCERAAGEFGLGKYAFQIIIGAKGALLEAQIESDQDNSTSLSMKFGSATSFSSLALIATDLPPLLNELREILRKNPL